MLAPTLYFLKLDWNPRVNGYEAWEQHKGQEKGCFMTQPEFITVVSKEHVDEFIDQFANKCETFGDRLEAVEVKE